MPYWLFQMDITQWNPERYRNEVWEGSITQNWRVGKKIPAKKEIKPGDTLVFLYVRTNAIKSAGIYGWGIVSWCNQKELHFRAVFPSDYLKMNPVPETKVREIVDKVRGGMKRGTMWELNQKQFEQIREQIAKHITGIKVVTQRLQTGKTG
jgi:hypothetical protein